MLRVLAAAASIAAPLVPWAAPPNPMGLTRAAGLVPEVNEHLEFHVHSHLDVFLSGRHVRVPAGIEVGEAAGVRHGSRITSTGSPASIATTCSGTMISAFASVSAAS